MTAGGMLLVGELTGETKGLVGFCSVVKNFSSENPSSSMRFARSRRVVALQCGWRQRMLSRIAANTDSRSRGGRDPLTDRGIDAIVHCWT